MSRDKEFDGDAGAPLPDFSANIQLQTVAPALGGRSNNPDYLDYDQKGRGVVTTMFANTGAAYMMGIMGGGLYGLRTGLQSTPSSRFKVKLNSVLNHCGRHGSRAGNSLGVFAVMYSLFEGVADQLEFDEVLGLSSISPTAASFCSPGFAAFMTGASYYAPSGARVAGLAGTIGFGAVGVTYVGYSMLGVPYGSQGFLFL